MEGEGRDLERYPNRASVPHEARQQARWRFRGDNELAAAAEPGRNRRSPAPPSLAVPVVVGTRPEAIKLVPIILALRDSECFHPVVVSTGQHHKMVAEIFELAGIRPTSSCGSAPGGRR